MARRISLAGITGPERWKVYVRGLQPKLKAYVLDRTPTSLDEAETLAKKGSQIHAMQDVMSVNSMSKQRDVNYEHHFETALKSFTSEMSKVVRDTIKQSHQHQGEYTQTSHGGATMRDEACKYCKNNSHHYTECHRHNYVCQNCNVRGHSTDRCRNGQFSQHDYNAHQPNRGQRWGNKQEPVSPGRISQYRSHQNQGNILQRSTSPGRNQSYQDSRWENRQRSASPGYGSQQTRRSSPGRSHQGNY